MSELLRTEPLQHLELKNAFVSGDARRKPNKNIANGVYTSEGMLVPISLSGRKDMQPRADQPDIIHFDADEKDVYKKGIYLGNFHFHYGHFILETISTFWFLQQIADLENYHLFFHACPNRLIGQSAIIQVLKRLSIPRQNILFVKRPTLVKQLLVPESAFCLRGFMNAAMKPIYHRVSADGVPRKKVYLSRTRVTDSTYKKRCTNEKQIEKIFKKKGFKVFYPEEMTFRKQLALYASAKMIAGIEGSALHNVLFTHDDVKCISLGSPRNVNCDSINQHICNALKNIDFQAISFQGENFEDGYTYDLDHVKNRLDHIL